MTIIGSTFVRFPLSMSVIMLGSVIGFGGATFLCWVFKIPVSSLLKKCLLIRKDCLGRNFAFSLKERLRINVWLESEEREMVQEQHPLMLERSYLSFT